MNFFHPHLAVESPPGVQFTFVLSGGPVGFLEVRVLMEIMCRYLREYCTRFNGKVEQNIRVESWQLSGTLGQFPTAAGVHPLPPACSAPGRGRAGNCRGGRAGGNKTHGVQLDGQCGFRPSRGKVWPTEGHLGPLSL